MLSNFYFLSALSILAEKPNRIKRLFNLNQINDQGVLAVNMYTNGDAKEVIMDDHMPCRDGDLCFSKSKGKEMWVSMLEKAWAKVHGSYERIIKGSPQNVLRDLTGAPTYNIDITEPGLIDQLIQFEQAGYIISASCASNDSPESMSQHAYQVLSVKQISD